MGDNRKNTGRSAKKNRNIKKLIIRGAIVICVVYFLSVLVWQQSMINAKNEEIEEITQKMEKASDETEKLKQEIENMSDPEYVERVAREKLGLVRPNERVFIDANKSEDNTGR